MAIFSQSFFDQIFKWWEAYAKPVPSPAPPILPPPPIIKPMFSDIVTDVFLAQIANVFKMKLNKEQGDAVRLLAKECDAQGITDQRQFAYILATCRNECMFKSIKEIRAKKGTEVYRLQERYWYEGFYGRGFSQLTWRYNYLKFSKIVGADLVNNPDKVLQPEIGAKILVHGMRTGIFTGKKLSDFINAVICDYFGARSTVNGIRSVEGKRQADLVSRAAERFYDIITAFAPK